MSQADPSPPNPRGPVQSKQFEALAETSADAIITSDEDDLILTWNKAAQQIFGHGQEVLGQPVTIIVPEEFRQRHTEGMRRFLATGERHILGKTVELEALRADGEAFPIELSLSTWREGGRNYFGAIIRDISQRKRMERLREDVTRLMRHDLKSPLIGITGYANLLLKGDNLTPKQRKIAEGIAEMGQRTLKFIDRTRDLYRIELGSYELEPRPVHLASLLERLRDQLHPVLEERDAALQLKLDRDIQAAGDETLLTSMLENLIKNAAEASPANGEVMVSLLRGRRDGQDMALIQVHNQGEVPAEVRDHFFEPYVTSGKKAGFGLGTYSARLIARAHGGDITFASGADTGTTLTVSLPLAEQ